MRNLLNWMEVTALVSFSVIGICSCCEDADPGEIKFDVTTSSTTVESGQSITFTDNSKGVSSRTWTFENGIPATSIDSEVSVVFLEGPSKATLEIEFTDGSKKSKIFSVQVGTELLRRSVFGFEGASALKAGEGWKIWNSESTGISASIDGTQGANGTSKCVKLTLDAALTGETQFFTKENSDEINAVLDPNTNYTLSFYIKGDAPIAATVNGNADPYINIALTNENSTVWGNSLNAQTWVNYVWESVDVTPTWIKISISFNSGDKYSGGYAYNTYPLFKFSSTIPGGAIYIDEVSLNPY